MYKGHTEAGGVQLLLMDARLFRNRQGELITPLLVLDLMKDQAREPQAKAVISVTGLIKQGNKQKNQFV